MATGTCLVVPAPYRATARISVVPGGTPNGVPDIMEPYLELVRQRAVLEAAYNRIQGNKDIALPKQPIQWLERQIQVNSLPRRGVLDISMGHDSPKEAALLVNAVAEAYVQVAQATSPQVTLAQTAERPTTRDRRFQIKAAGISAAVAFALIVVGIACGEWRARRIYTVAEATQEAGMPLIGVVPAMPARVRIPLAVASNLRDESQQEVVAGSMDAARTLLLHAAEQGSGRAVMVTSALAGEGKTSLATQLATSLARAGRKTLLIDGDLRSPAVHQLFYQPVRPGFAELLRREARLAQVVRRTPLRRLWLIPAGHGDSRTFQALAENDLRPLFDRLKRHFDFIVVDSGPALPAAESLVIGLQVDAVLFSVLCKVSRIPTVCAALRRLTTLGIPVLGAVVQGVHGDIYDSGHPYGVLSSQPCLTLSS